MKFIDKLIANQITERKDKLNLDIKLWFKEGFHVFNLDVKFRF